MAPELEAVKLKTLRGLEERGREIAAYEYNKKVTEDTFDFLYEFIEEMEASVKKIEEPELASLGEAIVDAIYPVARDIDKCRDKKKLKDCEIEDKTKEKLETIDKECKEIIGKRCTWLLHVKEPYSGSAAVNDVTAALHRFIELAEEKRKEALYEVVGKCGIDTDAHPSLRDACIAWDKATDQMEKKKLYGYQDYQEIKGRVLKDKAEFRVGFGETHRTHVNLKKGTLEYYDIAEPEWAREPGEESVVEHRKRIMSQLLEDLAGLNCSITKEGVRCTGVSPENVEKAAIVLSAATSMDMRILGPEIYWHKKPRHPVKFEKENITRIMREKIGEI